MQATASIRRVLSLCALGLAMLAAPLVATPAHACGPYGAPSPWRVAADTAMLVQSTIDPSRTVMGLGATDVGDDGEGVEIELVLQDEDGELFDRTFELDQDDDGAWTVTSMGPLRPRRTTA